MGNKGSASSKAGGGGARSFKEITDEHELDASVDQWMNDITQNELDRTKYYTGAGYADWNDSLRNDDGKGYENFTKGLDGAISKFNLDQDIITYRGLSYGAMEAMFGEATPSIESINAMKGAIVSDKAFLSTSIDKSVAKGSFFSDGYVFKINVPKGKGRGAYVNKISQHNGEMEFIMHRNTQLKVTGASYDSSMGRTVINVDYVK